MKVPEMTPRRQRLNSNLAAAVARGELPQSVVSNEVYLYGDGALGYVKKLCEAVGVRDGRHLAAGLELREIAKVIAVALAAAEPKLHQALLVELLEQAKEGLPSEQWEGVVADFGRLQRGKSIVPAQAFIGPLFRDLIGADSGRYLDGPSLLVAEVVLSLQGEVRAGRKSLPRLDGSTGQMAAWGEAIMDFLEADLFGDGNSRFMDFVGCEPSLAEFRERVLRYFEAKEGRLIEAAFAHELRKELRRILKALFLETRR